MYQIIYSSSPIPMMHFQYPNPAIIETIINSNHPIAKSQFCGPSILTLPFLGIGKMVYLKHEEIATNPAK